MVTTFCDWLASLGPDRLATLLRHRPDVLHPTQPRDFKDLEARLKVGRAALDVVRTLPSPAVTVATVLRAFDADLPGGTDRGVLSGMLAVEGQETGQETGRDAGQKAAGDSAGGESPAVDDGTDVDSAIDAVLRDLSERGLAWTDSNNRVHLVCSLDQFLPLPLSLGRSVREFLSQSQGETVQSIASGLGLEPAGGKRATQALIVEFLSDPVRVGVLLDQAPPLARDLLTVVAENGPRFHMDFDYYTAYYAPQRHRPNEFLALQWALEHGLVWMVEYSGVFEMPREVGLSLRGPDYRVPLCPLQPEVATTRTDSDICEYESAVAALEALDHFTAMLSTAAATPVALLKSGGIGVREIKRLATATRCTEDGIRLYLEIAAQAGLMKQKGNTSEFRPTAAVGMWQRGTAAERLRTLQAVWWLMGSSPLRDIGGGKRRVPLTPDDFGVSSMDVRHATVRLLAELPADLVPAEREAVLPAVGWRCPLVAQEARDTEALAAMAEATLLGLGARSGVTSVGRALAAWRPTHAVRDFTALPAGPDDMVAALEKLMARGQCHARFCPDLTAVVAGPPSTDLAGTLDIAADRESKDTASVWRFGKASIRRAFDAGQTAESLLASLAAVAQRAELPQPLVYLVEDVGRRHGEMRVSAVACCVVSDQPALLSEAAVHRKLAQLRPRLLAPTVMASALPVGQTLAALRDAGYLPVESGEDGTVVLAAGSGGPAVPAPRVRDSGRPPVRTATSKAAASRAAALRVAGASTAATSRAATSKAAASGASASAVAERLIRGHSAP